MLLVADTNVLVSECLRRRGRQRIGNPRLELLATERVADEFEYEFRRRLDLMAARAGLTVDERQALEEEALDFYVSKVMVVSQEQYVLFEAQARLRIPDDKDDWPTVALALALNAGVWTEDRDFFGCGLPTWRTDVLYAALDQEQAP